MSLGIPAMLVRRKGEMWMADLDNIIRIVFTVFVRGNDYDEDSSVIYFNSYDPNDKNREWLHPFSLSVSV